ncbi:MAG: glycosyltransferase family 2 protein [Deltaproteobacteria bacterium]|nr:glycosyltransferase family 2 protein [Deltaproteobacteria bacterium]
MEKLPQKTPDVSIVLAVYNEELSLTKELEIIKSAMDRSAYTYEVIVIDDCSTDQSYEIAKKVPWITLIRHRSNRGSGAARKTGLKQAQGQWVVWSDVDLSYPNEKIPQMIMHLEQQQLDQLIGQRRTEKGTKKLLRFTAKWIIRKIASILVNRKIPDLNSGLRILNRSVALKYLHMIPDGFSCVSTMTLAFLCDGYLVDFYPIDYKPREGKSKFHPLKDTYYYLIQVIRMVMYFNPLRIILPISLSVLFFGMCTMIYNIFWGIGGLQQSDIVILSFGISIAVVGLLADLIITINKASHIQTDLCAPIIKEPAHSRTTGIASKTLPNLKMN